MSGGGYNYCGVVIGLPGDGKTSLVSTLIKRHLRETRGIVIAHDPLRQFEVTGCRYYETVEEFRAAYAAAGKKGEELPRGASIGGEDADPVTELVLELGKRLNTAVSVRCPILYPADEGTMREGSGSSYMSKLDKRLIVTRRHRGVGPVINLQEVGQLTANFYRLSTNVYAFRLTEPRALELERHLCLEEGALIRAGLTRLPPHTYLNLGVRQGVIPEAL